LKDNIMKPWIKKTLVAVFGVGIVAGGLAACSHRDHYPRSGQVSAEEVAKWRGRVIERAGDKLQLDDAQKQRLGTLFDKLDEQRTALMGSTADPRAAMTALIQGERFDRSAAAALIGEKTGAVTLKSPEVIAAAADFFDALNPAQQAQVREFLAKRQRGHRG
jgi:periplasmic protein CpxP/Spy